MIDRIVIINDYIVPRGGATILARLAANQYRAAGLAVTYISGEGGDPELEAAGVTCIGLGQKGLMASGKLTAFRQGLHNAKAVELLDEWITANDTPRTAYHLHNWAQILSPAIFSPLERVASRTIVSCHDLFNVCPNGALYHYSHAKICKRKAMGPSCWMAQCDRRGPVSKYWRMIRHQNLLRKADFSNSKMTFVNLHENMASQMRRAGFKAPLFKTLRNPATAYTNTPVKPAGNQAYLFIGRDDLIKGYDIALEATARANQPIIMAGSYENVDELGARYPHADFVGYCNREDLARHAKSARAVLVPSRLAEPFGLVVAEAALSGVPILLSNTCTLAAEVEAAGAGQMFDPNDIEGLAKQLSDLAADDQRISDMGAAALAIGERICVTSQAWANTFIEMFEEKLQMAEGPQIA